MRALALLGSLFTIFTSVYSSVDNQHGSLPYLDALMGRSSNPLYLLKRQACPADHISCSALGNGDACCPNNTVCARDQNGNVACCPQNAVCTGVISGSPPRSTATGTATSSTPFVLGGSTTSSAPPGTTAPATLPAGYSTIPNQYYPFILIPTSYANSQQCLSAYTACQSASTACFNSLAGQNGVTISGLGTVGLTQAGITGTIASSASGICSSLSQQGCYGISSQVCSSFGSGTGNVGGVATQTTGFVQVNAGPAAVARCTGAFYTAAAAAVAGAGFAGMVMA